MTEPLTLITDVLLGSFTLLLGLLLLAKAGLPTRLWGWAFLSSALAAFAGGAWHGFHQALADGLQFWIWKAVMILLGLFAILAVAGSIIASCPTRLGLALLAFLLVGAAAFGIAVIARDDFRYVLYFNALAMGLLVAIHSATLSLRGDPASPWILAGVAVAVVGAVVYVTGYTPHARLNENDVFHLIQMAAMYLLFRGARVLGIREARM